MGNHLVSGLQQLVFSEIRQENHVVGRVVGLIEKPGPGIHASRDQIHVKEGIGCSGDHQKKDFWKGERIPGRQITMFSSEVARFLGVDPVVVGDNIVSEGIDLSKLNAGEKIAIGSVTLTRSEKNHRPCELFAERVSQEAKEAVLETNMRGALFYVETSGTIQMGDSITLLYDEIPIIP